jgi:hypothetical protein
VVEAERAQPVLRDRAVGLHGEFVAVAAAPMGVGQEGQVPLGLAVTAAHRRVVLAARPHLGAVVAVAVAGLELLPVLAGRAPMAALRYASCIRVEENEACPKLDIEH